MEMQSCEPTIFVSQCRTPKGYRIIIFWQDPISSRTKPNIAAISFVEPQIRRIDVKRVVDYSNLVLAESKFHTVFEDLLCCPRLWQ